MKYQRLFTISVLFSAAWLQAAVPMADIAGGRFRPPYLPDGHPPVTVKPFRLDKYPVTNAQFAEFVRQHPQWQRGRIKRRQADAAYLQHWQPQADGSFSPKPSENRHPVTRVSWFAANAYCRAQGKRLPATDRWEYAARASERARNGIADRRFTRSLLRWYEAGGGRPLHNIGQNRANFWGVHDMHGLIWEWTEDFNNALLHTENSGLFCGGGETGSNTDPAAYAALVRHGLRSSLEARFSLAKLGFRCAAY